MVHCSPSKTPGSTALNGFIHKMAVFRKASTGELLILFDFLSGPKIQVTDSEQNARLAELRQAGICPNCGKKILEGTAVVRGRASFCSLKCVALFNESAFIEQARKLKSAAHN